MEWSLARCAGLCFPRLCFPNVQQVLFGTSRHLIGQLAPRHAEPRLLVQVEHEEVLALVSIAPCRARLCQAQVSVKSVRATFVCVHQGSRARRARFCSCWRSVSGLTRGDRVVCGARKPSAGSERRSGYLPRISCRMMWPGHEGSRVRFARTQIVRRRAGWVGGGAVGLSFVSGRV